MALDKVIDSAKLDAQLVSIADAIRSKGGTTDQLTLAGMVDAINAIQTGSGSTGLAYDMGEFVLESDSNGKSGIYINHNFGERPEFILVWTDAYVGVTNPDESNPSCLGFVWFENIMGLDNWITSSAKAKGTTVSFQQARGASDMTVVKPNSVSYIQMSSYVTSENFRLVPQGNTTYWRAGITYKYFVSKAWWNVGGVASAE